MLLFIFFGQPVQLLVGFRLSLKAWLYDTTRAFYLQGVEIAKRNNNTFANFENTDKFDQKQEICHINLAYKGLLRLKFSAFFAQWNFGEGIE